MPARPWRRRPLRRDGGLTGERSDDVAHVEAVLVEVMHAIEEEFEPMACRPHMVEARGDSECHTYASTRDHFPADRASRALALKLPQNLHGAVPIHGSGNGHGRDSGTEGFRPTIFLAFTHEQDDVRALVWLLDVAAAGGRIR